MDNQIRVTILSNNRLLRESLARTLNKRPDIRVVAAMQFLSGSADPAGTLDAEILLLDSIQCLKLVKEAIGAPRPASSNPGAVLVAMDDDPLQFMKAVRGGALGYVLKEASAMDVVNAVRAVAQGESVCPPRLCKLLFDFVADQKPPAATPRSKGTLGLTRRERQLVPLIGQGLTNKEIASQLNLSEQTIKNHIHRILHKVGVEDRFRVLEAYQAEQSAARPA